MAAMVRETLAEGKAALQFLTRLPVPGKVPWQTGALAAAAPWFPLVGALVGALAAAAFALASWLGLPALLAALLAVTMQILATGALHEDGLADLADGLGGGRDAGERLAIMRDPRLGSCGVLALLLVTLARILALAALAAPGLVAAALIAAGSASRAALPALMAALPPARADGLAAGAGRPHPLRAAAAGAIAVLAAFLLLPPGLATQGLAAASAALLGVVLLARRRLGGYTGDVLGAAQQLAETGFLLGVLLLPSPG
jgi:adenosylcobinamide-GDP ribazoletransferase